MVDVPSGSAMGHGAQEGHAGLGPLRGSPNCEFFVCSILAVHGLDFDALFLCGRVEVTEDMHPSTGDDRQQATEQEAPTTS